MEERIKDKIEQIDNFVEELEPSIPETFEEYEKDFKIKAICERYLKNQRFLMTVRIHIEFRSFEKIIEAVVDLTFLFIRKKKYPFPEEDKAVFDILADKNVISKEFAEKLSDAKSMRNIIAHKYGEIDDSKIFQSVRYELIEDVSKFIKAIEKELTK